jgi:hypothetical protein
MEIEQPLSGTQCYLQPEVPWENRMRCVEQVVVQRLVRHELVDQKPLRALIGLRGAVADELDEVRVLDDAQELDLGQPFLVSLNNNRPESDGWCPESTGDSLEVCCDRSIDTWPPWGLSLLTATAVPCGCPPGRRRAPL